MPQRKSRKPVKRDKSAKRDKPAKKPAPPAKKEAAMQVADLPGHIDNPIEGITEQGYNFINILIKSYRFGNNLFANATPHHEDWIMLFVILSNEAVGRATVTKNIVEITGRAYATVRCSLTRFETMGYIESNQRIGRSNLYVPTKALKNMINQSALEFWPPEAEKDVAEKDVAAKSTSDKTK